MNSTKLFIDYLKEEISDPINTFMVCANLNCDAYKSAKKGELSKDTIEEMTLFRGYVNTLLHSEEAIKILKNTIFVECRQKTSNISSVPMLYVVVNYPDNNYKKAKRELSKILA